MMRSGTGGAAAIGSGTLSDVPLAHALVYIRAKRLTGVFEMRAPGGRDAWVVFSRGNVVSVSTTPTVARFDAVVYEMGLIDDTTLDETMLESMRARRPQAEVLVERGAITLAQQRAVVAEQACRRVHHLFTFPTSTVFTFREAHPSSSTPDMHLDVLAPIWRALVDFPPVVTVRDVLAIVNDRDLRLMSEAALERAGLGDQEKALCRLLAERPRTLVELRNATALPRERVDLLVYLLVISRCAQPEGPGRSAAESHEMWAVRPEARAAITTRNDLPAARASHPGGGGPEVPAIIGPLELGAQGIRARARTLDDETTYETLGLLPGASPEAARAAFHRLSRLWSPARLPIELDAVRAEALRIFDRMQEAHRLLTDPDAPPNAARRQRERVVGRPASWPNVVPQRYQMRTRKSAT